MLSYTACSLISLEAQLTKVVGISLMFLTKFPKKGMICNQRQRSLMSQRKIIRNNSSGKTVEDYLGWCSRDDKHCDNDGGKFTDHGGGEGCEKFGNHDI
ncbi:unnamed protein product [Cochlearia groenlandica]